MLCSDTVSSLLTTEESSPTCSVNLAFGDLHHPHFSGQFDGGRKWLARRGVVSGAGETTCKYALGSQHIKQHGILPVLATFLSRTLSHSLLLPISRLSSTSCLRLVNFHLHWNSFCVCSCLWSTVSEANTETATLWAQACQTWDAREALRDDHANVQVAGLQR